MVFVDQGVQSCVAMVSVYQHVVLRQEGHVPIQEFEKLISAFFIQGFHEVDETLYLIVEDFVLHSADVNYEDSDALVPQVVLQGDVGPVARDLRHLVPESKAAEPLVFSELTPAVRRVPVDSVSGSHFEDHVRLPAYYQSIIARLTCLRRSVSEGHAIHQ